MLKVTEGLLNEIFLSCHLLNDKALIWLYEMVIICLCTVLLLYTCTERDAVSGGVTDHRQDISLALAPASGSTRLLPNT